MSLAPYFRLTRPRTLTAAFSPVFLGTAYGYAFYPPYRGMTETLLFEFILLLIVMLAQIAANIWNEYYDFKSGLDRDQIIGNSGSITRDGMTPQNVKRLGKMCTAATFVLGIFLSLSVTLWFIPIGILCVGISYLYSAGPFPLSRTPYGELAAGTAMGLAIVLIAAYIWTGHLAAGMLIPAVPSLILVGSILMANNMRDMENDRRHGRRTLIITMGRDRAITLMRNAFIFVFLWLILFALTGALPKWTLLAIIIFPKAMQAIRIYERYSDVHMLDQAMGLVALTNTLYHLLFGIGLLLG